MRKFLWIAAYLFLPPVLSVTPAASAAEYYKLEGVRRVEQDLYKTRDKTFIETQYCYHYTYGEDAVLKWEGPNSSGNTIVWDDNSTCRVKRLFK
jgi:hypothetical protein